MPQKPLLKPGKKIEKKKVAANRHGKTPVTKKGAQAAAASMTLSRAHLSTTRGGVRGVCRQLREAA